jgi:glutaredoxin
MLRSHNLRSRAAVRSTAMSRTNAIKIIATCALFAGAIGIFYSKNADAQQLYRQVGPDGRVSYSDKPPTGPEPAPARAAKGAAAAAANTPAAANAGATNAATASTSNPALPADLRQSASRYPVTLYTGENCAPCGSARAMLTSRGIPFSEKTISSNEDVDSLKRLSGETSLPFATIGGQQLKGYSDLEWTQYLDAAGYPKQSQLPRNYRNPAPTPLVARAPAAPATPAAPAQEAAASAAAAPAAPAIAPPVTTSNPTGLRF